MVKSVYEHPNIEIIDFKLSQSELITTSNAPTETTTHNLNDDDEYEI